MEHTGNICQNIRRVVWSAYTKINAATSDEERMDACMQLMSGGYYKCLRNHKPECTGHSLVSKATKMNNLLNNSPATFKGLVVQLGPGNYNYTCSRNNNFTNRSQKATIIVASN